MPFGGMSLRPGAGARLIHPAGANGLPLEAAHAMSGSARHSAPRRLVPCATVRWFRALVVASGEPCDRLWAKHVN